MAQEFCISDDMLDFAHKLDTQNHNIRSYRKRQAPKKNNSHHKKCQNSVDLISFHLGEDRKVDKSAQRTQRATEVLSTKRFSSTAGVKKRSQLDVYQPSFIKTGRTKLSSAIDNPSDPGDTKKERQNASGIACFELPGELLGRFSKREKQLCKKGQLKNKHFEDWINQVLLQSCHNEKFDSTIENAALKKYGIDKNSLLSKGINPENLDRIFRALFVYSMGFNTLLKEMGGSHIRKALWKVYAILLQYCSDGDFQTMIGEIERDKVQKMQLLRQQIQKRQQIIDNNQEIHQQKNAKIFKELKYLRDVNVELANDKNVLMEDYKQAEQAFNEEVSLRLRFENKINEIHGVHRQLGLKHQKLYDDLQIKTQETTTIKQKMNNLTEKYIQTKNNLQFEKTTHEALKEQNRYNLEQIELLKQKNTMYQLREVEWNQKQCELIATIQDKERKLGQLKKEINNVELMLQLKSDSEAQLQKEYKRSLQQNKNLLSSLQTQLQQLNKYMLQKKQFNDTHSRLYAQLTILNSNLIQKQQDIQKSRQVIKNLKFSLDEKNVEVEVVERKNQQLNVDLSECYNKIEEMKRVKDEIQDEVNELRSKEEVYKQYYVNKEEETNKLTEQVEELERRVSEFNITKKTLESRVALLTQKIASDQEMNRRKIERLQEEIKVLDKERKQLREQVEERRAQATKNALLYEQTFAKLKDHIFERNDLELRYNQSLCVVESQTDHIKTLNIKISELQQRIEESNRKMKGMEFMMQGKQKTFSMELKVLNNNIHSLKEQLQKRKNYIHPMKYEDSLSKIINYQQKIQQLMASIAQKASQSQERQLSAKIEQLTKEMKTNRQVHEDEIAFKNRTLDAEKERNRQLQEQLQKIKSERQQTKLDNSFKEKQKKYLQFIKEKGMKIEQLLKEIQKMQDSHSRIMKQLQETKQELSNKKQKIDVLQQQQINVEKEKNIIIQQRLNFQKEKQYLQAKIQEKQRISSRTIEMAEPEASLNSFNRQQLQSRQRSQLTSREDKSREKQKRAEWRNDFSKKVKNAYTYYNK